MNNAAFIAAYKARREHRPGMAAAKAGPLLACPVCGTPNFSEPALREHVCPAKHPRERLTLEELKTARFVAGV